MDQPPKETKKFYVGLCMAGAVSAGSYTAGVVDYLLEALEEWEKRRGEEGVPSHRVEIPVLGGASAGGMTSIITAAALKQGIVHFDQPDPDNVLADHPENILYHSWVDLTGEDMFAKMLDTSDIKPGDIVSALNSGFIDRIAERAIRPKNASWQSLPPYFSKNLKVFTTLSNLQGFEYNVAFRASRGNSGYYMQVHNDYACFQITDELIEGPNKGWMPLNFETGHNSQVAINAAMATGAFPVGLKSRILTRETMYVTANPWLEEVVKQNPIATEFYSSLNVDGGMLNNEPFDRVRDVLMGITGQKDKSDYQSFNRFESTVLMIAPFPSSKRAKISITHELLHVIGLTFSAMVSQMRSKISELVGALDNDCAGQYMIDPSREFKNEGTAKEESVQGDKAIACGALNGFSGFLNKEFRVHDYFLGRYNAKIFLRDYFTVPKSAIENNQIFRDGYAHSDLSKFKSTKDDCYQIIPVFDVDYTFPAFQFSSGSNWPAIRWRDVVRFRGALKKRTEAVMLQIKKLTTMQRFWLWIGSRVILRRLITHSILVTIRKDLKEWQLLR